MPVRNPAQSPIAAPSENQRDQLTRDEVLAQLGIKPATLYTYVSRGLIRSFAQKNSKARLFAREDVERVKARAEAKAGSAARAEGAMRWGEPVISTSITEITPDGPRYRHRLAVDLALGNCTFEAVAQLLWSGTLRDENIIWQPSSSPVDPDAVIRAAGISDPGAAMPKVFALIVLALAAGDGGVDEIQEGITTIAARQILHVLAGCFGYLSPHGRFAASRPGESIATTVARALELEVSDEAVRAINAALILSADHELAPATFAARIAASTGADLHACVGSALLAHGGAQTGLQGDRLEDLIAENAGKCELGKWLDAVRDSGSTLLGFNLPLYPRGDPRADTLITVARELKATSTRTDSICWFIDHAKQHLNAKPSLAVGLVTLALALGLPHRAASALWALGRVAGLVAHIREQRLSGYMLRPRARFIAL